MELKKKKTTLIFFNLFFKRKFVIIFAVLKKQQKTLQFTKAPYRVASAIPILLKRKQSPGSISLTHGYKDEAAIQDGNSGCLGPRQEILPGHEF